MTHSPLLGRRALFALQWLIASMEGYDLAVYGVSIPAFHNDPALHMSVGAAGLIGSLVGIGMLFGAAIAGATVARIGPKRLILISAAVFTIGMLGAALAPNPGLFGLCRLITGLGLGVVLPTLNAHSADLARPEARNRMVAWVMSGYAIGALLAPLLGAALIPTGQWRWLYVIGALPLLCVLPAARRLPDSPAYLRSVGRTTEAEHIEGTYGLTSEPSAAEHNGKFFGLAPLLAPGVRRATVLFWGMSFCGLVLVFGISAWLPTLMQLAGYSVGNVMLQTAMMWAGVFAGAVFGGRVADAIGPKAVVITAFLIGTVSLIIISLGPNVVVLYVLMFVAGMGFIGSQLLTNAFIVDWYPGPLRGSGIGWALSVGRFGAILGPSLGSAVLSSGLPVAWGFWAFAVPALIGCAAAAAVPTHIRTTTARTTTPQQTASQTEGAA